MRIINKIRKSRCIWLQMERYESDANGITCDKNKRINKKWVRAKKIETHTHSLHEEYKKRKNCMVEKVVSDKKNTKNVQKSFNWSFDFVAAAVAATTVSRFCSISYMYLLIFINLKILYYSMENCRWRMLCSLIDHEVGDESVTEEK